MIGRMAYQNPWKLYTLTSQKEPYTAFHDMLIYYIDYLKLVKENERKNSIREALMHFISHFKESKKIRQYFTQNNKKNMIDLCTDFSNFTP